MVRVRQRVTVAAVQRRWFESYVSALSRDLGQSFEVATWDWAVETRIASVDGDGTTARVGSRSIDLAADLDTWTRLLGLHDDPQLARAEPGLLAAASASCPPRPDPRHPIPITPEGVTRTLRTVEPPPCHPAGDHEKDDRAENSRHAD